MPRLSFTLALAPIRSVATNHVARRWRAKARPMGKLYDQITPKLADWLGQQRIFFVATAPLSGAGLLNCSPKGMDTFRILDPQTVAYLDLTGSGVETIAHLRENGRII